MDVLTKKQRYFLAGNARDDAIVIFILISPFSIFMFFDPFPFAVLETSVRYSQLTLSFVWKRFCWFIPSFSFLSFVWTFCIFSFITHSKLCVLNIEIFQLFNQFICISSVTGFSKESNKLITHGKLCVLNIKIFQFFNQFICVSSVTEFSKEQNKLSTSTVYHKH